MKPTAIVCAIVAASLSFSSLSFAQGDNRRGREEERPRAPQQSPQQTEQHGRNDHNDRDDRRDRHDQREFGRHHESRFDQRDGRWNERRDYYNARGP